MTKDQVKVIMKGFSKNLGVECDFCHDVPDMASDKLGVPADQRNTRSALEDPDGRGPR